MRRLIWLAFILACVVVPFGAYVRLSDAGLGCPDWPGCYGQISPHHAAERIQQQQAQSPDGPVSLGKAWKEMSHRYLAGALGALIVAIGWQAWRRKRHRRVAGTLLAVVLLQGLLGMWTVTLLLKPAIVTLHLIGGVSVLLLLAWLALSPRLAPVDAPASLSWLARALALAVALQLALGGWVSTNYAALACQGFPACNGEWWPQMRFEHAFHLFRALGEAPDGSPLAVGNLVAVHWLHRLGAALVTVLCLSAARAGWRLPALRGHLCCLLAALSLQIGLGVANVLLALPLPVAVLHNAGAACLLLISCLLALRLRPARAAQARPVGPLPRLSKNHREWV
ncbi:COX15/CtaA family protein [Chromobacterium rhizoryzae]|uniref:COX15/CtaA family protein n=1 Tax=Chromobacterium rhizoryzae TaxID=1778675 RepID=UPI001D08C97A|nr:COX15/CtaA family protein [Chromobacterium rhizoryzae]